MGATALGDVEGELPGVVTVFFRRRRGGEQFAHVVEQTGVGRQIGARGAADGFLVHLHQTADVLQPGADAPAAGLRSVVFQARLFVAVQPTAEAAAHQFQQRLADQAGLARTGNPGHRRKAAQREIHVQALEVVARHAFKLQPALGLALRRVRRTPLGEQVFAGLRGLNFGQPRRRPAVQHLPAMLTGRRADVDQPVGPAHGFQVMLHHKQRIARGLQTLERGEQRFAIGRVQARRRFIQHIDHAEQLRAQLRGQAQTLQLAGRQGRRTALQGQIAQAQFGQGTDPLEQILGDALGRQALFHRQFHRVLPRRHRAQHLGQLGQRQLRQRADIQPGKRHRQRRPGQPFTLAQWAGAALHELRHALFHQRALGVGEGVQDVAPRPAEGALVTRLQLALERLAGLLGGETCVHRHGGGFFGEQDPVALFFRQLAPWDIDVIAQGHEDVAQVLPLPRQRPGRHRALADGQGRIGHHQRLGHFIHATQAMALRARALGQVRRKILGIQHRLTRRIATGAGVKHADQTRQGGDTAHRRPRTRRAALLLQGHGRRQAFDGIHIRHADLVDQAPRIGRHRLEITALGLGIHRGKRQGRFARARYAGEHHQGISRNIHIDVAQVMFAGAAHTHKAWALGSDRGSVAL